MVALLLEFGADPDGVASSCSPANATPLILACSRGHLEPARLLAQSGARPGLTDRSGACALVHAAREGHLEVVNFLVNCEWNATVATMPPSSSSVAEEVDLAEAAQQAATAAAEKGHEQVNIQKSSNSSNSSSSRLNGIWHLPSRSSNDFVSSLQFHLLLW